MNWRLLLSEHRDAILQDPAHVVILALLERFGMLSEAELQRHTGIPLPELLPKLLSLHRDSCVDYDLDSVRVSDRGRRIIERFSLQDSIVDLVLKDADIPAAQVPTLKRALLEYRRRAFAGYLSSVAATHSWSYVCRSAPFRERLPKFTEPAGTLAILLSDLRAFLKHDLTARLSYKDEDSLKLIFFTGHGEEQGTSENDVLRFARQWVLEESEPMLEEHRPGARNDAACLYFAHDYMRHDVDAALWSKAWSRDGRLLITLSACHSGNEVAEEVVKHWKSNKALFGESSLLENRRKSGLFTSETTMKERLDSLLPQILSAETLSELSQRTGFAVMLLRGLLERLNESCKTLLADATDVPERGGDIGSANEPNSEE